MRSFNEFQRLLNQHGIDGKLAIVLTEMYEAISENNQQLDQASNIMVGLAKTMENFVSLNEAMVGKLETVNRKVSGEEYQGVTVRSEPREDN
jgi:hypothetical protein